MRNHKRLSALVGLLVFVAAMATAQIYVNHQPGGQFLYQDYSQSPGEVMWVSSTASGGSDASGYGYDPDTPYASVDYAIGQATGGQGDIIYVMPGHVEDGATATQIFDADTAGISIIGLGQGSERPRFDYNGKTTYASVGADNVTLKNLTFRPSAATVAKAIDVESSVTNATIENCEFMVGEEGDGTDEFVITVKTNDAADDLHLIGNSFRTHTSADGCTEAVHLGAGGSVSRSVIKDNDFYGNWSTAAIIDGGTACDDVLIRDNTYRVQSGKPGISLESGASGVFADNYVESSSVGQPDTIFVTCTLSHDTVTSTAFEITTASSGGALMVEEAIVQNGGTAFDSAADGAVFELFSDNASGSATWFKTTEASLSANAIVDIDNAATTGNRMVLESGKKIKLKATTEDFTSSTGNATIYLTLKPLAGRATVSAGAGCQ